MIQRKVNLKIINKKKKKIKIIRKKKKKKRICNIIVITNYVLYRSIGENCI